MEIMLLVLTRDPFMRCGSVQHRTGVIPIGNRISNHWCSATWTKPAESDYVCRMTPNRRGASKSSAEGLYATKCAHGACLWIISECG
jgi:hypothetical protein